VIINHTGYLPTLFYRRTAQRWFYLYRTTFPGREVAGLCLGDILRNRFEVRFPCVGACRSVQRYRSVFWWPRQVTTFIYAGNFAVIEAGDEVSHDDL